MVKKHGKGWIGLDLGHRSIAVAQVERLAGTMRIVAASEMPRTTVFANDVSAADDYRDVGKQELATGRLLAQGLYGRTAACVLPMSATELTHESLPPGNLAEQRAMIASELGDGEPRQFDVWSSNLARDGEPSPLADVSVISIAQSRASLVAEQVTAARLDCRVLDGLPHTVARAVTMTVPERIGRPLGGLHLAYDSALFVVSQDGIPVFARKFRDGGIHRIVTRVSETLGLSTDEAIHVLREFGLPEASPAAVGKEQIQDIVGEIAGSLLDGIADELNRTLSYLSSLGPKNVPDSVCLLGEGAAIPNLTQQLSSKADTSIWNWDLPGSHQPHSFDLPPVLLAVASALSSLAWES